MKRLIAATLVAAAAALAAPVSADARPSDAAPTRTFVTWVAIPGTREIPCQAQRPDIIRTHGREWSPVCYVMSGKWRKL